MSENGTKLEPKTKKFPVYEGVVNYCPLCGFGAFDEADNTNNEILCGGCNKTFIVQMK